MEMENDSAEAKSILEPLKFKRQEWKSLAIDKKKEILRDMGL